MPDSAGIDARSVGAAELASLTTRAYGFSMAGWDCSSFLLSYVKYAVRTCEDSSIWDTEDFVVARVFGGKNIDMPMFIYDRGP